MDNEKNSQIDEAMEIITGDVLTIDNPVVRDLKEKINNALACAVIVADGNNSVTITAKLVIDSVTVGNCGKKIIHNPVWSVKVTTKNDVYDDKEKLNSFIAYRNEESGFISAHNIETENQISISDLQETDE